MFIEFEGKSPKIGNNVFIAPTAVLIGDVTVGDGASIWFGAVLRADFGPITIGAGSSIQDNVVIHTSAESPTMIGENVIVGHNATIEGCRIGDQCVIGMGATVLTYSEIGEQSMLAANSVVIERQRVPARVLVAGVPGKIKKELSGQALTWTTWGPEQYHQMQARYRAQGIGLPDESG
ncbi:MAG: gamma carbonic anhydrase family protein [Anaerolineae bacterium]|nr:gamma carbonic anhydrase family protein [Anaerolineae bacterium]